LDPKRGIAPVTVVTPVIPKSGWRKKGTVEGLVSAVTTGSVSPVSGVYPATSDVTMHSLDWIGAVDLDKAQVLKIKSVFKCFLCRSNEHPWPVCEFLASKWDIKKKPEDGKSNGRKTPLAGSASAVAGGGDLIVLSDVVLQEIATNTQIGAAHSVRFASSPEIISTENRFAALSVEDVETDSDDEDNVLF
jgi:hypothetical protein